MGVATIQVMSCQNKLEKYPSATHVAFNMQIALYLQPSLLILERRVRFPTAHGSCHKTGQRFPGFSFSLIVLLHSLTHSIHSQSLFLTPALSALPLFCELPGSCLKSHFILALNEMLVFTLKYSDFESWKKSTNLNF